MVRDEIKHAARVALAETFPGVTIPDFSVEVPENPEHGDYATNAALILAKVVKKPPLEIAQLLVPQLLVDPFERVTAVTPGFLNFWLTPESLRKKLVEILRKGKNYGSGSPKKERIQIEFISANPTGPLTLANGRGGFLGDALARILEFKGYKVEREYYVNDAGNQILTLGRSVLASLGIRPDSDDYYHGDYIKKWAITHRKIAKANETSPESIGKYAAKDFLDKLIKPAIKKMVVKFDRWTSEQEDIRERRLLEEFEGIARTQDLIYEDDGARWLKTSQFGDDKNRVLVTSDRFPTYFYSDAAHYLETKERGFDLKINILGADHYGYVSRIQAVAKIIGLESKIIITQLVRLVSGGKEVRMSKRKGSYVTIEELIDEVGLDAARFFFLMHSPDSHMDFDLELAKERSQKNPVYYVQYAHARIASIFRKAKNQKPAVKNLALLKEKEEAMLMKKLIQLPEVAEDIARDYQVLRLTRYATELARAFHDFYEKQRVITDDKELTAARLALVKATQIVLQMTLALLGISAPEKM